jgi:YHS domain-containing protein
MNKTVAVAGAVLVFAGVCLVGAQDVKPVGGEADVPAVKKQTICPVMGGAINTNLFVDHEGKRLYVCCKACVRAVTKDPAKWFSKAEAEGITLDKIQTACPVTDETIDKAIFADYEGKRVYFCCQDCLAKFKADPKTIVDKLEKDGIVLDKADKTVSSGKSPAKGMDHSTMQH